MNIVLDEILRDIQHSNKSFEEASYGRWFKIAKPLHSLGKFEKMISRISAIKESVLFSLNKKRLIVFCADNGIVEEGVTQAPQEVTKIVAENMLKKQTSSSLMADCAHVDILPIDIGINGETTLLNYKVAFGTKNFIKEPAMSKEDVKKAIKIGIHLAKISALEGVELLCVGEMGIGNTTTATALITHILNLDPQKVTGRGAGLDDEALMTKMKVIKLGIEKYKDLQNPMDILGALGGLDIAGMVGLMIGAAYYKIPLVLDGLISWAAALVATRIEPKVTDYLLASHASKESVFDYVAKDLELEPIIYGDMSLGEGSGALMLMPLLDMALRVYLNMATFDEIKVDQYEDFKKC